MCSESSITSPKNTYWGETVYMQPVWQMFFLERMSSRTLENTQWGETLAMQLLWKCFAWKGTQVNTDFRKTISICNQWQLVQYDTLSYEYILVRSHINVTSVTTVFSKKRSLVEHMWIHTGETQYKYN